MSKVMKIVAIIAVALLIVSVATSSFAAMNWNSVTPESQTANASDNSTAAETTQKVIGAILTIAQVIGVGVAIIMLVVLAIKYISAAPSDKAEIKKHAVVYVVGAIVLFAAAGILQIIRSFAEGNVNSAANGTN